MRATAMNMGVSLAFVLGSPAGAQTTMGQSIAAAKPGEIRLLATAAIRLPLSAVIKQAEAAIGKPIHHGCCTR